MSYADDVAKSETIRQSDKIAAGSNQALVLAADVAHFNRLVAAEEAWPGNSNGALATLVQLDPTKKGRGSKGSGVS